MEIDYDKLTNLLDEAVKLMMQSRLLSHQAEQNFMSLKEIIEKAEVKNKEELIKLLDKAEAILVETQKRYPAARREVYRLVKDITHMNTERKDNGTE